MDALLVWGPRLYLTVVLPQDTPMLKYIQVHSLVVRARAIIIVNIKVVRVIVLEVVCPLGGVGGVFFTRAKCAALPGLANAGPDLSVVDLENTTGSGTCQRCHHFMSPSFDIVRDI